MNHVVYFNRKHIPQSQVPFVLIYLNIWVIIHIYENAFFLILRIYVKKKIYNIKILKFNFDHDLCWFHALFNTEMHMSIFIIDNICMLIIWLVLTGVLCGFTCVCKWPACFLHSLLHIRLTWNIWQSYYNNLKITTHIFLSCLPNHSLLIVHVYE